MISLFPEFKKIKVQDKNEVEKHTRSYPPYSDFNFASLWSYNTQEDSALSNLNGNLVLSMPDYITNKTMFSFFGFNQVPETIKEILEYTTKIYGVSNLQLIPEICIEKDLGKLNGNYKVSPDVNNHDYILSLKKVTELKGSEFHSHRNMISKFKRKVKNYSTKQIKLTSPSVKKSIINLTLKWGKQKNKSKEDIESGVIAIKRMLNSSKHFDLYCLGVFVSGDLVAFFISELAQKEYVIGHFRKANVDFPGIFQFIDHETAKFFYTLGYKYFNFEQDLGFKGMRDAKSSLRPVIFLKKYTVSVK